MWMLQSAIFNANELTVLSPCRQPRPNIFYIPVMEVTDPNIAMSELIYSLSGCRFSTLMKRKKTSTVVEVVLEIIFE